ncbi:MAG TPA: ATP-binding protein [Pyrinomonadaceae bacterium]|nr:ATP-binding protein [Pyrinomonadaceae bacterium]
MVESIQNKCRILIVENRDDARTGLAQALSALGHNVIATGDRQEALARNDLAEFDLIVSDLDDVESSAVSANIAESADIVKAFKVGVTGSPSRRAIAELHDIIEKTLWFKLQRIDAAEQTTHVREKIDLELPSDLTLMNAVLEYLLDRVGRLGLIKVEQSNLFVALDEAFVNAVRHGNRNDPTKLLRVTAELSAHEAIFTVEDEGDGFDVREIPDPRDPANLFKSSGRGVLLIYNIMDEVEYSERGTRLKMVKRPQGFSSPPRWGGD